MSTEPARRPLRIRRARLEEADTLAPRLTELCRRSKAHWGYPQELLERWADDLRIEPADIDRDVVLLAEATDDAPGGPDLSHLLLLGFARVGVDPDTDASTGAGPRIARLHDLWVEPQVMGQGIGRTLMEAAIEVARTLPAERLRVVSDPNAEPFYERFGTTRVGEEDSDIVAGRRLPILELPLSGARARLDPAESG